MALTERSNVSSEPGGLLFRGIVGVGETIYDGALVMLGTSGGGDGEVMNWDDSATTNTNRFLGVAHVSESTGVSAATGEAVTGNTANTVEISVDISGVVRKGVTVAGTPTAAKVGDLVYASDENTYTMTATAGSGAIGWLRNFRSATDCDVQLFSAGEFRAFEGA